jgi:uncharacterized repeat protein (TIGR03833 family)
MSIPTRLQLKPGLRVRIVLKQDQSTGKLTEGILKEILTSSPAHPHGIKVRLTSGAVGRVKEIVPPEGSQPGTSPNWTKKG